MPSSPKPIAAESEAEKRPSALPPGYRAEQRLSEAEGVWVLRAVREADSLPVVLRMELDEDTALANAELTVLAAIEHAGIARLVDHGSLPRGGAWVAREWIDGEDLLTWSRDRSAEEIGGLLAHMCVPLAHLHREGFVHADVKAENVIVTPAGRPVICDFGLSCSVIQREHDELSPGADRDGASGTLFSLAPEVLMGLPATTASDLFALGAMLHRLLVGTRRSARDFYSAFPSSSFLDAAGTDPESLPVWSRDLIATLTARAPERRPQSASEVGRVLADRLGLQLEGALAHDAPRWPVAFGREVWLASWLRHAKSSTEPTSLWIRTPTGEDPRPMYEHMRVYAALRGSPSRGVDLAAELDVVDTGVALDEWARHVAADKSGRIIVCLSEMTPWLAHGLESLSRACALEGELRGAYAELTVVSAASAPDENWQRLDVPEVDTATAQRFVAREFSAESGADQEEVARLLAAGSGGSATRADRVLANAARQGSIFVDDGMFRIRAGSALRFTAPIGDEGPSDTAAAAKSLTAEQQSIIDAIAVTGDGARPDDVLGLAGRDAGGALSALRQAGWVTIERTAKGPRIRRLRRVSSAMHGTTSQRAMHARWAEQLAASDASPALTCLHRLCAEPTHRRGEEFVTELQTLIDLGRAEEVLGVVGRFEEMAPTVELSLIVPEGRATLPEGALALGLVATILIERARAWCAIGQTDMALQTIAPLSSIDDSTIASAVEIMRAHVAALRHETDEAFAFLEHAEALDPARKLEVSLARIHLLHTVGRDEEVVEVVREFAPREHEAAGELPTRKRIYVESLAAMSLHRLGHAQDAASETRRLAGEAERMADVALEAALRINLSHMERSTGSLSAARSELEHAIELYDRSGLVSGLAHARAALGGLLRDLVELEPAEPLLLNALEMRTRLGDKEGARTVRGMLGLLLFERGHARAAIETLESAASAMSGAQQRRFAPILQTKAIEMRARIGDHSRLPELPSGAEEADPRILFSKARIALLRNETEQALDYARRTQGLAHSLKLHRLEQDVAAFVRRVNGGSSHPVHSAAAPDTVSLGEFDDRVYALLLRGTFAPQQALDLAEQLERRGRDDRAARMYLALATRTEDETLAHSYAERAATCLDMCTKGLTESEASSLRRHLLGEPDPAAGDLATRRTAPRTPSDLADEIAGLLEINQQLLTQKDVSALLGVIVDHALRVTCAERGFLVLEEHGDLRFDTALDSCRGDIAEPEFEVSASIIREALDEMTQVRVSNAVDDPLLGHRTSVVSLELRSVLCTPFRISDDLRGAIYLDHRLRKGAFDDRSARLCSLLAGQAALAIQQMKRMQEIRSLNRQLEKRVMEREAVLRATQLELAESGNRQSQSDLIGDSDAMQAVRSLIRKAAPSSLPVLVSGQSGTGKELAVRSLHKLSNRSDGPLVSESCAAFPASLIESELFGFRRGAFTGADRDHAGLFEQADGGTLFLDEIGEMPLELQAKLLRVIETGQIRRIGDNEARRVDVRLVVATNRNLELESAEGRFRTDLYYRVNGINVELPPLSRRTEDIPMLAEHFLRMEDPDRQMSKHMRTALARRTWPGNVRELRNEIARLCVLSEDALDDPKLVSRPAAQTSIEALDEGVATLAEIERRAINAAIEHAGGDKRRAAELLGISRAKIYQRLKAWEEAEPDPT